MDRRRRIAALALSLLVGFGMAHALLAAELTTWGFSYPNAYPAGLDIGSDGTVYVADAQGIAVIRLDPTTHTFRSWGVGERPYDILVVDGIPFCTVAEANALVYFHPEGLGVNTASLPFGDLRVGEIHRGSDAGAGNLVFWIVERNAPGLLRFELDTAAGPTLPVGEVAEIGATPQTVPLEPRTIEVTYERFGYDVNLIPAPEALAPPRVSRAFTDWTLPLADRFVEDIAVAPDGTLWISFGSPLLLRFDPVAGTLQMMETIQDVAIFQGLLPAEDGSIWFGNILEGSIGHFDPQTGLSEVWRIPGTVEVYDLVFGPDESIWYTDRVGDAIGRLKMREKEATVFDLPDGSEPLYLEVAADGSVWFTAGSGGYVGRLISNEGN